MHMEKKLTSHTSTICKISELVEGLTKVYGSKEALQSKVMHFNPFTDELSVFDRKDFLAAMSNNDFKDKVVIPLTSDALKSNKKWDYKYTLPDTTDVFLKGEGEIVAITVPFLPKVIEIGTKIQWMFSNETLGPLITVTRFVRDGDNVSVKFTFTNNNNEYSCFSKNLPSKVKIL